MKQSETSAQKPIRRVGIVAKSQLDEAAGLLTDLQTWLTAHNVTPVFETSTAALAGLDVKTLDRDDLPSDVDMVLVLGGDGTLLSMAGRIAEAGANIPMLAVNFGGLGFLTEITLDELYPSLELALNGTAKVDQRHMLRAVVKRNKQTVVERLVLNEVTIMRGASSPIMDLAVSVGSQFVANFKADGLIVASPTGSTAYNLAVGGPIVHPLVEALILTPIAPHTLTNRPIVLPKASEVRVQPVFGCDNDEVVTTFDGQFGVKLQCDDIVCVSAASGSLKLFRAPTRNYFAVLREKLKWAER